MTRTRKRTIALLALAASTVALAEPAPEDAAKYRQSIMKSLGGHISSISLIVRGKAGSADNLGTHVQAIVGLSAEVDTLFAAGSDLEDDEALPAIWENPAAFADAVASLEKAAGTLNEANNGEDARAMGAALKELGGSCKGCHEDFRLKK